MHDQYMYTYGVFIAGYSHYYTFDSVAIRTHSIATVIAIAVWPHRYNKYIYEVATYMLTYSYICLYNLSIVYTYTYSCMVIAIVTQTIAMHIAIAIYIIRVYDTFLQL